ncbi:MAG: hypothetical protein U5Q44_09040 [Dehalococcoidia bacterium]|nr:hypothetical protein [Dehalococcoidia bacterium]
MARADARTGVARSVRSAVTSTVQQKMGMRNIVMPGARIRNIVTRKFAAPMVEEDAEEDDSDDPQVDTCTGLLCERAVCRPACVCRTAREEPGEHEEAAGGSSQNERALMRGNAMSAAPICSGTR